MLLDVPSITVLQIQEREDIAKIVLGYAPG